MRKVTAVLVATVLATAASAQMKVQPQQQPPRPAPTQKGPVQITTGAPQPSLESARRISRDEAIKLVKAGKALYVDVRSKDSYDMGHIKGAINIPFSQLSARINELPKGKMIVAYCA